MDSPLQVAVEAADVETVTRLLDAGDNIDQLFPIDGSTLLHRAIDSEVDASIQTGSPLDPSVSLLLVRRGIDLRPRNDEGMDALHYARYRRHEIAAEAIAMRLEGTV